MLLTAFFTPSTHSNYSSSFNSSSIYTMRWKPAYKQREELDEIQRMRNTHDYFSTLFESI
ncbi:unnamed protein product, partial [Brassica oleracea var. botrytis]